MNNRNTLAPCTSADSDDLFVLLFSQAHVQFRRAEFESVCQLVGICPIPEFHPAESHFQLLRLNGDEQSVRKLLSRSVLLKSAFRLLLRAPNHEALLRQLREQPQLLQPLNTADQSWCLQVRPQFRKRDFSHIQSLIKQYTAALGLTEAPIDLECAHNKFTLFEVYEKSSQTEEPREVLLARLLGEGQTHLKVRYALTNRCYIGNSTMDPELAFIQANLALTGPGTLAIDPFCGTGGLLVPAAHFGAHVLGVEIKWDVARAKGKSSRAGQSWLDQHQSVRANFEQYGLDDGRFLGILLADSSQHGMWKLDRLVDAVLADPPYGIRERGQKLGTDGWKYCKQMDLPGVEADDDLCEAMMTSPNPNKKSQRRRGYPEKQRYQMSSVFLDLLDLGSRLLRPNGRLTFWFPVCRSEYSERILPRSDCMRLVHNCEQQLTKDSARRLLVYEKVRQPQQQLMMGDDNLLSPADRAYFLEDCYGHETFRQKVFNQQTEKEE